MKTSTIRLIIIFSALSLIGLITTQTFWVTQAIKVSEKHYEHRAQSALNSAIDEISHNHKTCQLKCLIQEKDSSKAILILVDPRILDSLLRKYVGFFRLDSIYEFAIVKSHGDSVVYASKGFTHSCPDDKIFKHCLSSIFNKIHYHVELIFPSFQKHLLLKVWNWFILSIIFLIIIIFCFGFIIFAVFRQKKLSDMKSDFINNMTHEFKTPISTISLASEILVNSNKETSIEKIHQYAKIIYDENQRMRSQVEQVLRMAQLDKNEYELNKEEIDVHELIKNAVGSLWLENYEKSAKINYIFNASNYKITADPVHLSNIIKNLVENAYKYSCDNPEIEISTTSDEKGVFISVKDNGIGIAENYLKYIFDKFYRVPTGNVHDVKGFGIGLYYVKIMAEAHSGKVSVESEIGKGSKFTIFLPFGI